MCERKKKWDRERYRRERQRRGEGERETKRQRQIGSQTEVRYEAWERIRQVCV